ncbi:hypothetical protein [Streptomyces sp. NBC_01237]|uniref:hypothetical protein n=1 Tax=Streptomyces sp. NBC_01237 TaxID=2903790 RepID=UPI002DDAF9BD|nr:hypothetical protein [Streptomyces sp. NBC_01237]WRZ71809.1 hypothetical protein OG251_09370 [Streptomyces sp. NBC_01237]
MAAWPRPGPCPGSGRKGAAVRPFTDDDAHCGHVPQADAPDCGDAPLDPACRAAFAQDLLRALRAHSPGSRAELSGPPARGTADVHSDIDINWTVPDDRFAACTEAAPDVLRAPRPLESLRTGPDLRHSPGRRLLLASFVDLPLFRRLDLEIGAAPAVGPPDECLTHGPADGGPGARGEDWSRPAGALANAVAAVKAVLREQPRTALGLLERGFRRIDAPDTVTGDWPADIARLAAAREPGPGPRADRVARLVERHLGHRRPPAAERPGGG